MTDAIGRKFAPVPNDATLTKNQENMLYFYTSALSVQSSAAVTIQAYVDAKTTDPDTVTLMRDYFINDIKGILEGEYGDGSLSIQSIMDNT